MNTSSPQNESSRMAALIASGPPYMSMTASLGGRPDKKTDVPISAVFIAIFVCLAVVHMSIFRKNKSRDHFFLFSAMTFGFCMSRIVTFIMRIVWAVYPHNIRVGIAANIFISAGTVLLYVINLNYTQRILRAYHARFGNSKPVNTAFLAYYVSIVLVLIMVIATTVQSFYTLDKKTLKSDGVARKFGSIWFTVFAFVPIPIIFLARFIPSSSAPQNFGKKGSLETKNIIAILSSVVLTLGISLRAGTSFLPPRRISNPAWYHSRAVFYVFVPMLEVVVVVLYAATRVDQRFFVNGKAELQAAEKGVSETDKQGTGKRETR